MGQKKCCLFKDLKALQNKGKCEKVQFIKFVVALWKHFFLEKPMESQNSYLHRNTL